MGKYDRHNHHSRYKSDEYHNRDKYYDHGDRIYNTSSSRSSHSSSSDRHSIYSRDDRKFPGSTDRYYSKYLNKKYREEEAGEDDGRNIVEISGLDKLITERVIEDTIRKIAIKNGFSPPNSVTIFFKNNQAIANFTTNATVTETNTAHIEFPSGNVASKFLKALNIPKIKVQESYYSVKRLDKIKIKDASDVTISQSSSSGTVQVMNSMVKIFCDWNCPCCNYFNFSKRTVCLKCNASRPEEFQQQSLSCLTNITNLLNEYSSWIVIKDIPHSITYIQLIDLLSTILHDITGLERCYYFVDKNGCASMGFLFAVFTSQECISSYFNLQNTKCTSQNLNNTPLRLDLMLLKEQVVASDLVNRMKFTISKHTIPNQLIKPCKIFETSTDALENLLKEASMNIRFSGYTSNWMGKTIWFASGSTDSDKWPMDKLTGYHYNRLLNLYYDSNSRYYMLSSGSYFIWDEQSSCLIRVEPAGYIPTDSNPNNSRSAATSSLNATVCSDKANDISISAKILEEAKMMAKVSQSFKVLSSTLNNQVDLSKSFALESEELNNEGMIEFKSNQSNATIGSIKVKDKVTESNNKLGAKYGLKISGSFTNRLRTAHSSILEDRLVDKDNESNEDTFKISSEVVCFTCLRYFDNKDQLSRHERMSEYHKFIASQ